MRALRWLLWILAQLAPLRRRASWRWYRWACGGRWSRSAFDGAWRPVSYCPGAFNTDIVGGGPMPVGACFDEREDGGAAECSCEVWP